MRPRAETIPARAHTAPSTVSTPSRPRAALEHPPLARAIHPSRPSARAARARSPNPSHLSHRLFPIGVLRALTNGRGVAHERSFASSSARDRTRTRSSLARRPRAPNPPHIARSNRLASARALDTTPTDARARHDDASRARRRVAECAARVVAERARADARIPKP